MRSIVRIMVFLAVFVLFSACFSSPVVWDTSLSEEQMTTVSWGDLKPVSYNGIAVEKWKTVQIPAGTATMVCNINNGAYIAQNKEFSYHFEAGIRYYVRFGIDGEGYWGASIYDRENLKKPIDFVRFKL